MNKFNVVIAELQLIVAILAEDPKDARLAQLVAQAKLDLAAAAQSVITADPGRPDDT